MDRERETRAARPQIVQSVVRAALVAQALASAPEGMRLSELTKRLDLRKTTVLRLLNTLISLDMAYKDDQTGRYRWRPLRWLGLFGGLSAATSTTGSVDAVLEELAAGTGETATLSLPSLDHRSVMAAATALSGEALRADPRDATELPMHALASGKIFLGNLPPSEARAWMAQGLPALTEHTITSPKALIAEVATAASQGYATSKGEVVAGINSVAVPVADETGRTAAAVVLLGPAPRMSQEKMVGFVPRLQAASRRLSRIVASLASAGVSEGDPSKPTPKGTDGGQDSRPSRTPFRAL